MAADVIKSVVNQSIEWFADNAAKQTMEQLQEVKLLQKGAKDYLIAYEDFKVTRDEIQRLERSRKLLRNRVGKDQAQMTPSYIKQTEMINQLLKSFTNLYHKMHTFHNFLNSFLDQKIVYTIVIDRMGEFDDGSGTPIIIQVDDPAELLMPQARIKKSTFQLNMRFPDVSQMTNRLIGLLQAEKASIRYVNRGSKEQQQALADTYNSVMYRYNKAHEWVKKNADKEIKSYPILWKPQGHWLKMFVSNKGDLQQAYAIIIYSKRGQAERFALGNIEKSVGVYMTYVEQVDATSGAFAGDTASEDGKFQYAVKTAKASGMGYIQMATLAKAIIEYKVDVKGLNKIRQALNKEGEKTRRNFIEVVGDNLDKIEQQLYNHLKSTIEK